LNSQISDLPEDQLPGLDIAMLYLASTYDERNVLFGSQARPPRSAGEKFQGEQDTSAAHKEQIAASDVRSPSQIFTSESGALAF
jgi:hypothetical protein